MGNVDYGNAYPFTVEAVQASDGRMCHRVVDTSHYDRVVSGCYISAIGAHNHARSLKRERDLAETAREENDARVRCINTGAQCGSGDMPW